MHREKPAAITISLRPRRNIQSFWNRCRFEGCHVKLFRCCRITRVETGIIGRGMGDEFAQAIGLSVVSENSEAYIVGFALQRMTYRICPVSQTSLKSTDKTTTRFEFKNTRAKAPPPLSKRIRKHEAFLYSNKQKYHSKSKRQIHRLDFFNNRTAY